MEVKTSKLKGSVICISSYIHHCIIARSSKGKSIYFPFMKKIFLLCFNKRTRIGSYRLEWGFVSNMINKVDGVSTQEIGAGKRLKTKKIKEIVRRSACSVTDMQALCDLICYSMPKTVIELGTAAGFTTRALALAVPKTTIISIEGNNDLYQIAKQHLHTFNNVYLHWGLFDTVLPTIKYDKAKPVFAFIDGNHTYAASIRYVQFFLSSAVAGSIIVLHDIRWSTEMIRAWKDIKKMKFNGLTLESYTMGIIFIRKEREKQEFFIRY